MNIGRAAGEEPCLGRTCSSPTGDHSRGPAGPRPSWHQGKNNSCHCFHPVTCIYPLFHFQQYCSTLVLKTPASLSFTPLLEQPSYYEKIVTLPLTFSTRLKCHQTQADPLALHAVPLVPLLQRRCFHPPHLPRAGSSTHFSPHQQQAHE